jgi:hypothetical protein
LRDQHETVLDRDSEEPDEADCGRHIERFSSQDQRKDAANEGVWYALGCKLELRGGPPSLTNDAGTACYGDGTAEGRSFTGVASGNYWSSLSHEVFTHEAWLVFLGDGNVTSTSKDNPMHVWPVRGGPR